LTPPLALSCMLSTSWGDLTSVPASASLNADLSVHGTDNAAPQICNNLDSLPVNPAATYRDCDHSMHVAEDTVVRSKVASKPARPQSAERYAHGYGYAEAFAMSGFQRPKSARAASSNHMKMWARTSQEKSFQEKQEALRLFSRDLKETLCDRQYEGQLRREAAEAHQRSRRHTLTGDPWRSGGACAGTVRPPSLSRTHGSTTSGLFSDFQPLEGSESTACLRERLAELRHPEAGKKRREEAEALRRSRAHWQTGQPWRIGGACAGTVRSASLSRTHGSTISGLFSDVQPLAGSESIALMEEKVRQRAQWRSRLSLAGDSCRSRECSTDRIARGKSVPSLLARRSECSTSSDLPEECGPELCVSETNSSEADVEAGDSCAGSALAKIRSARRNSLGRRSAVGGA